MKRSVDPIFTGRRWLLKSTLALTALGLGLGASLYNNRGLANAQLTAEGKSVLKAFTGAIFSQIIPSDATQRQKILELHLNEIESWIFSMPAAKRLEINLLLSNLATLPTRYLLISQRSSWQDATDAQVLEALERLKSASSEFHRVLYVSIHGLITQSFGASPNNWSLLNYPGPYEI